jgi:hypothetical protein
LDEFIDNVRYGRTVANGAFWATLGIAGALVMIFFEVIGILAAFAWVAERVT